MQPGLRSYQTKKRLVRRCSFISAGIHDGSPSLEEVWAFSRRQNGFCACWLCVSSGSFGVFQLTVAVGGTGAYACQLAKNVFKAGKVITTVSTSKVAKVPELLGEGVVDQSWCLFDLTSWQF